MGNVKSGVCALVGIRAGWAVLWGSPGGATGVAVAAGSAGGRFCPGGHLDGPPAGRTCG